jgi:predicted N-acetyltransferase YhbS
MNISLRLENKRDYRLVENLTREAFWDLYHPGCLEHFILHKLRGSSDFIPELDYVALADNVIAGNIIYSKASVIDDSGNKNQVITSGHCN